MKKEKNLSIIIPVKGTPLSLVDSLKGYLNQTLSPLEIVVVGASEDIAEIKKSLKSSESKNIIFIKFLGDKNEALNAGYSNTSGEYILFTDHDMIPQADLVASCMRMVERFDALVIPEKGIGGASLLAEIHRLEKELVMNDEDAITPRFFMRSLFKNDELPFNKKFGVLDEWGFYLKLKAKKPRIGTVDSFFTVTAEDFTLLKSVKKQFRKGLWVRNLISVDKEEALRRINPVKRGIQFYGSRFHFLKKEPVLFSGLVCLKFIDLVVFFSGYLVSLIIKPESNKN